MAELNSSKSTMETRESHSDLKDSAKIGKPPRLMRLSRWTCTVLGLAMMAYVVTLINDPDTRRDFHKVAAKHGVLSWTSNTRLVSLGHSLQIALSLGKVTLPPPCTHEVRLCPCGNQAHGPSAGRKFHPVTLKFGIALAPPSSMFLSQHR